MRLPKSISPCPIKAAVAEVRFESDVPAEAIFGIAYQKLKTKLPDVRPLGMVGVPSPVGDGTAILTFHQNYQLQNETSVAFVGPGMISVGMRGGVSAMAAACRPDQGDHGSFQPD
jgi:uncharacterized protein (TIGR04255 family)